MNTQNTQAIPKAETVTGIILGAILEAKTGKRYQVKEIYKFEELSDKAKQRALEKLWNINVEFDWWDWTYEDAKEIGLKITGFDISHRRDIKGKITWYSDEDVSKKILKNHGDGCETYKIAKEYLGELLRIKMQWDEESVEYEEETETLHDWFLKELLNAYWNTLNEEYFYLTSEEAIKETIECNEYDFDEDGNLV